MKKILFLVKKLYPEQKSIFNKAAKKLGTELHIHQLDELVVQFTENGHKLSFGLHDIKEFSVVFFRTVGAYIEEEILISHYCQTHTIPVVDSVFSHTQPWIDRKSFEYQRLTQHSIPVIPSFFISQKSFSAIAPQITYPTVVKVTNESQGKGVYKCHSYAEILEIFEAEKKPLLIQTYIENSGDIRVFIIGGKIVGAIKRSRSNDAEFRNNVSLGGTAQVYQLSQKEAAIALQAAQKMQYEIAGVDLIQDQSGQIFVMEVNRAPQFNGFMEATNIDIPYKIVEFLVSKI